MNEYFKLDKDEEVSIVDSNFADEAIAYMNREGSGNCDEFLKDFERLRIVEEVCNPMVEECFNIIRNLMEIAEYVKDYRYTIPYFEKAIEVMTDQLQIAMDFNERQPYTEGMMIDFVTEYDANMWYAKEVISDTLNKIFTITKKSSKEELHIYKEVTIPIYTIIQKIVIDEVEFKTLEKAQDYINHQILIDTWSFYKKTFFPSIKIVVCDELEVFELHVDMQRFFKNVSYLKMTLQDALFEVVYDLPTNESHYVTKRDMTTFYDFDLKNDKNEKIKRVDLNFLYEDIYSDMNSYLLKHRVHREDMSPPLIDFAFSTLKDVYTHQIKDDESLDDHYLILKLLSVDDFSNELKKYYRFNEYSVDTDYKYGLRELRYILDKLKRDEK